MTGARRREDGRAVFEEALNRIELAQQTSVCRVEGSLDADDSRELGVGERELGTMLDEQVHGVRILRDVNPRGTGEVSRTPARRQRALSAHDSALGHGRCGCQPGSAGKEDTEQNSL